LCGGTPQGGEEIESLESSSVLLLTLEAFKRRIPPSCCPQKKEDLILLTAKVVFLTRSQVLWRGPSRYARRWRKKKGMPHSTMHNLTALDIEGFFLRKRSPLRFQ